MAKSLWWNSQAKVSNHSGEIVKRNNKAHNPVTKKEQKDDVPADFFYPWVYFCIQKCR